MNPGTTVTNVIYIKNTGNTRATLALTVDSWTPSGASSYITVSWNRQGAQLDPGAVLSATIQLTVYQSVQGIDNYSFNINVDATG